MPSTENNFKSGLMVSAAPHFVTKLDTQKTMMYVLIGLAPAAVASTILFGFGALLRIILGMIFACASEWCYNKIMKKPQTIQDLSCCVTGAILAMNVPANFPVWMLAVGCAVAIIIVKCLYGGIGRNIANPALVGRAVLLLSWTSAMTTWPLTRFQRASGLYGADAVTGATPLGDLAAGNLGYANYSLLDMFLGNTGGALGETCTIAILIGGIFLIWKKIISPIIPCSFIGTVFIISLVYYAFNPNGVYNAFQMAIFSILAGGVMFGAFFCATDYVTSPILERGKLVFGIGCGALTVMIRILGSYPEGVSFAILLMNIFTPLIDRWAERSFYGIAKREKEAKKAAKAAAASADTAKEAAK